MRSVVILLSAVAVMQGAAIGIAEVATAEVPAVRFTYEGALRTPEGAPLNGTQQLSFAVFRGGSATEADSGTLVYGETIEKQVTDGKLVHAVGSGTPTFGTLSSDLLSQAGGSGEEEYFVQVSVGAELRPILPRTRLKAVPYAGTAGDSAQLGGVAADEYVRKDELVSAVQAVAREAKSIAKAAGTGYLSFIGGGQNQDASGGMSAIAGGTDNHATWWAAFIGGGSFNWATGAYSAVVGGLSNAAIHDRSFVGGGFQNRAEGYQSTIGGGAHNRAIGPNSVVPGGQANVAQGIFSFAAGRRAKALTTGTVAWADSQDADFTNSLEDSFAIRARQGFRVLSSLGQAAVWGSNSGVSPGVRGDSVNGDGVMGISEGLFGSGLWGYHSNGGVAITGFADGNNPTIVAENEGNGQGIRARTHGSGTAIQGIAGVFFGTGSAGSFRVINPSSDADALIVSNDGNGPGIRVSTDKSDLIVAEDTDPSINVRFRVTNAGDLFADGTLGSPAADFAELLPAVEGLTPGDVLVIGPDGRLTRSSQANQTTLVGVYSTKPALLGGQPADGNTEGKVPLGVIGVLPTKVTDENGPITPGDILVTSSTPGHAMKASANRPPDTALGKALAPHAGGTGVINVLVNVK